MHILVVEDDRIIRTILTHTFKQWGHTIVTANDGVEAWERLQKETFHMVISDWMMPNMNGVELCQRVRSADFEHYTYFILLTAKSAKSDIVKGIEAGADDFMTKPFDQSELRVRVRAGERVVELERRLAERNQHLEAAYSTIQADLKAAAHLQTSLLPVSRLNYAGYTIDWLFQPCSVVGGDGFNFLKLNETTIAFYLWDVAGHGIPAAMLSVTVSKMLALELTQRNLPFVSDMVAQVSHTSAAVQSPAIILEALNKAFQADDDSMQYFTMIYGILDTATGKGRIGQAGHPSPLLISPHRNPQFIGEGGFPIGLMPNMTYQDEEHTFTLAPGERLFLYTDGLTECLNSQNEQYSPERLQGALLTNKTASLPDTLATLKATILDWRGHNEFDDDLSVLAIERLAE